MSCRECDSTDFRWGLAKRGFAEAGGATVVRLWGVIYLTPRGVFPEGVILSGAPLGTKSKDLIKETLRCRPKQQGVPQGEWVGKTPRPLIYLSLFSECDYSVGMELAALPEHKSEGGGARVFFKETRCLRTYREVAKD